MTNPPFESRPPPKAAEWILRICHSDQGEHTHLGDFAEMFGEIAVSRGRGKAVFWYWMQIWRSLPGFLSNRLYWSLNMLRNYALISFRTMVKNKGFSLIALLGLAVGLACFILTLAYVRFETSFDRFHDKTGRIFRLINARVPPDQKPGEFVDSNPEPLAALLEEEFPEIQRASLVMKPFADPAVLKIEDKAFAEEGLFVDDDFLEIFSFPFLRGDKSSALSAPGSIVLSERTAKKLFGEEDPVGRALTYGVIRGQGDVRVTGVVEDVPRNSHLQFDYLLSVATLEADKRNSYMFDNWNVWNFTVYAEIAEGGSAAAAEAKFDAWLRENHPKEHEAGLKFFLQPVEDIHLRSNIRGELATNNEIRYIYLFLSIAVLTLLIASINYMNLVTARSSTRAREIGVRKVTGAGRRQLFEQFLGESVSFAFLAFLLALALVRVSFPVFRSIAGVELLPHDLLEGPFLLLILAAALLTGFLSGIYPALVLSSFQPTRVLKELSMTGKKGSWLRNFLVVTQFTASVVLVVCALVVSGQLRFIQSQNLGFDREHIVIIPIRESETSAKANAIRNDLLGYPEVRSVSLTSALPTNIRSHMISAKVTSDAGETITMDYYFDYTDENFLDVFGIALSSGRNFSEDLDADEDALIVNESFAARAGWAVPAGKEVSFMGPKRVVGVVSDFYFRSFHSPMAPMVLAPERGRNIAVRLRPGDVPRSIALLKEVFERNTRSQPFEFTFFDDDFDALYRKEKRTGQIFGSFALLAVVIASLGLLGLASFSVERRTKEIGIRKVMGASVSHLALRLSREFVILVLLANIIAWPLAYFAMSRWLQEFTYRIGLSIWTFLLAAAGAFLVALLTVSTQTLRAATANPVEALRYE